MNDQDLKFDVKKDLVIKYIKLLENHPWFSVVFVAAALRVLRASACHESFISRGAAEIAERAFPDGVLRP